MLKAAAALSFLAAAALAGCASRGPESVSSSGATAPSGARIVTQAIPYRPGTGVVQSVSRAPDTREPLSVLAIRMDDGYMQYIDTASNVPVGSRVQLTPDHKIMIR
ncbi:MAG: hypothetical protein EPO20_27905 [Betaproteobacteria bacterium]|nr:MAG: hypothetical protein EPO20_27905 [Betaproteobacteria bacterium]